MCLYIRRRGSVLSCSVNSERISRFVYAMRAADVWFIQCMALPVASNGMCVCVCVSAKGCIRGALLNFALFTGPADCTVHLTTRWHSKELHSRATATICTSRTELNIYKRLRVC